MLKHLKPFFLKPRTQQPRQPPVMHAAAAQSNLRNARLTRACTAAFTNPSATPAWNRAAIRCLATPRRRSSNNACHSGSRAHASRLHASSNLRLATQIVIARVHIDRLIDCDALQFNRRLRLIIHLAPIQHHRRNRIEQPPQARCQAANSPRARSSAPARALPLRRAQQLQRPARHIEACRMQCPKRHPPRLPNRRISARHRHIVQMRKALESIQPRRSALPRPKSFRPSRSRSHPGQPDHRPVSPCSAMHPATCA